MSDLPERICIWEADKSDPNSTRSWTASFPDDHQNIYVRASMNTRPAPAATDTGLVTVAYQYKFGDIWLVSDAPKVMRKAGYELREVVTRENAEAVIAKVEAEKSKAVREAGHYFAETCMMAEQIGELTDTDHADAFPQPSRKDGGDPCGECRLQPGETCDICGANADRADDLAVDRFAIAMETVEYQFKPGGNDYWTNTTAHNFPGYKAKGWQTRELVTRSQALSKIDQIRKDYEELLAAERAEKKRLRGLLTSATYDLARANDECGALTIDNAAKDARVKELEKDFYDADKSDMSARDLLNDREAEIEALEAKLAAAQKALEFYRDGFKYHPKRTSTGINISEWKPTQALLDDCGETARAVLGGKTS